MLDQLEIERARGLAAFDAATTLTELEEAQVSILGARPPSVSCSGAWDRSTKPSVEPSGLA